MNILDENITRDQVDLLRAWKVRCRWMSGELSLQGMKDDNIIPFLLTVNRPTFFSRDSDFFGRDLIHARYCLVFLDAEVAEAAFFVRRVLKHPSLNTQALRMGKVIRAHAGGLELWSRGHGNSVTDTWPA